MALLASGLHVGFFLKAAARAERLLAPTSVLAGSVFVAVALGVASVVASVVAGVLASVVIAAFASVLASVVVAGVPAMSAVVLSLAVMGSLGSVLVSMPDMGSLGAVVFSVFVMCSAFSVLALVSLGVVLFSVLFMLHGVVLLSTGAVADAASMLFAGAETSGDGSAVGPGFGTGAMACTAGFTLKCIDEGLIEGGGGGGFGLLTTIIGTAG